MLGEIEAFLKKTGMPPSNFGRSVAKDPRLVFDMRRGREPQKAMRKKIADFILFHGGK